MDTAVVSDAAQPLGPRADINLRYVLGVTRYCEPVAMWSMVGWGWSMGSRLFFISLL